MTSWLDDDARTCIREDLDSTMLVVAGAGTGKTTALVGRVVELVRAGAGSMRDFAAITFTEAAAAELRERVRRAVEVEAQAHPGDARIAAARQEVDEAAICTLHAFAQRILTEHCVAAGVPPGFEVLDATTERADFDARWARFADELLADPGAEPVLVRGFALGLSPIALADLARALHEQRDRLEDCALEALRAARPGPEEWPVITAQPVVEAIDAALSMAGWCTDPEDKLSDHLRDVLIAARAQLRSADDEQSMLQALDNTPSLQCKYGQQQNWGGRIDEVRAACASAESARRDLLGMVRRAVVSELGARLADFVVTVADDRRAEGRLGFHDLLVEARDLLRRDREATDALRRRYRRLLIDEFQDTDPIQVELAARLCGADVGSDDLRRTRPGALFLVGDPEQSIYRFRRADIELFWHVRDQIGDLVGLQTNFRSVPGILAFVNTVFDELFGPDPAPGQSAHQELLGERGPVETGARRPAGRARTTSGDRAGGAVQLRLAGFGPEPDEGAGPEGGRQQRGPSTTRRTPTVPPVVVLGGPRTGSLGDIRRQAGRDVADAVAQMVRDQWPVADPENGTVRAVSWRDIAVLIPARSSLSALEEAFEDTAVPYRLEGVALLWASDDVRDVLSVLHAADDPADPVAVLAALRSSGLACGDDDLVRWRQAGGSWDPRAAAPVGMEHHPVALALGEIRQLHDDRWWSEPSAMVAHVLARLRSFEVSLASHRPRDHWHRLRWLLDQARMFDETAGGPLRDFLRWADLEAADDRRTGGVGPPDPDDDAVRVMTIHGAKGLEFPAVVLAGLERDPGVGHRPPQVLFPDIGTPELSAGVDFRTPGYELASARERQLDALEHDRLLYVGMTRARDHLLVSLHHRETSTGAVPAVRLIEICERHRELWRRPPIPTAAAVAGSAAAVVVSGPAPRPTPPTSGGDGDEPESSEPPDVVAWRERVEAFETRRRDRLAAARCRPVTTATAVAAALDAPHSGPREPAVEASARAVHAPGPGSDVALQIGRAVHGALAVLDLATWTDAAGQPAELVVRSRAGAHDVGAHADDVVAMVEAARRAPAVQAAATRRHWRELYVASPVGDDGVLEGFIDLVVDDPDGLVVVDYKTDRTGGPEGSARAADRYLPQVASYADALESATGRTVCRCVLVFLGDGDPIEVSYEGNDLSAARAQAIAVASELVSR